METFWPKSSISLLSGSVRINSLRPKLISNEVAWVHLMYVRLVAGTVGSQKMCVGVRDFEFSEVEMTKRASTTGGVAGVIQLNASSTKSGSIKYSVARTFSLFKFAERKRFENSPSSHLCQLATHIIKLGIRSLNDIRTK